MQNDQDTDGDEGMLDVNEVPRFGLEPSVTLRETALAFADLYDEQGPVNGAPNVFYCILRAQPGQPTDARQFVVKKFLKRWRPTPDNGPRMTLQQSKRAAREVEIMQELALKPDLFVQLQQVYVTNRLISIVMTRYEQDLHELCVEKFDANQAFTNADVRTVAARTLHALSYLHETLGVAHRDVKHQNIFLKRAGDVSTAVLGDMGHARSLNTGEEASTLGSTLGTVSFNPPEMGRDAPGPHTRRVDLYQLGAMLYLLILGPGPQRLHNIMNVIAQRTFFTDPAAIAALIAAAAAEGPSGAARAVCVRRMLADDPQDRRSAIDNMGDPWVIGAV